MTQEICVYRDVYIESGTGREHFGIHTFRLVSITQSRATHRTYVSEHL